MEIEIENNGESQEQGNMLRIEEKLADIQQRLKVEKGQMNKFANYKYRTCSDILRALKPLLDGALLTLSDEMIMLGDRYYIKATAKLRWNGESIEVTGFAREQIEKKGNDEAQITGTASTYSRKYALGGLFGIDDSSGDPDHSSGQYRQTKISLEKAISTNFCELGISGEKIGKAALKVSNDRTNRIDELTHKEQEQLVEMQKERMNKAV